MRSFCKNENYITKRMFVDVFICIGRAIFSNVRKIIIYEKYYVIRKCNHANWFTMKLYEKWPQYLLTKVAFSKARIISNNNRYTKVMIYKQKNHPYTCGSHLYRSWRRSYSSIKRQIQHDEVKIDCTN